MAQVCNALCMSDMATHGTIPTWTLGDRMRKALEHADIGAQEMADYLGVSRTSVSNWMHGRVRPDRRTLMLWALRTGVDLVWITSEGGDIGGGSHRTTGWLHGHRGRVISVSRRLSRRLRHTREAEHQHLHYAAALDLLAPPVLSHAVASIPRPRGATDPIPIKSRRPA